MSKNQKNTKTGQGNGELTHGTPVSQLPYLFQTMRSVSHPYVTAFLCFSSAYSLVPESNAALEALEAASFHVDPF